MWSPEKIKAQLIMNKISYAQLTEECGISSSQLSTILTKTQLVLPRLVKILGENPFILEEAEITDSEESPQGKEKSDNRWKKDHLSTKIPAKVGEEKK